MRALLGIGAVAVLAVVATVLLTDRSDPDRPPSGDRHALDGRAFAAASAQGRDLLPGQMLRLSFAGGRIGASAGCNDFGGAYGIDADRLVLGGDASQTLKGCAGGLEEQESWYFDWLSSRPRIDITADAITLRGGGVTVRFANDGKGQLAARLASATWRLVGTITSGGDVEPVPRDLEPPTLAIDAGGVVALFTGCNRGGGTATVGDDRIEFGPIATTRRGCRGAAGDAERRMLGVLQGTVRVGDDPGDLLVLRRGQDALLFAPQ